MSQTTTRQPVSTVPAPGIWGDETGLAIDAVRLAARRIRRSSDPKTTARPASELAAAAGPTVTPEGIGADAALRIFEDVLAPATRAQDDPMNLAYIPASPTRAALAFDAVVSSFNIFGGLWEAGAGAIFAENQALAWLVGLLGWPETAGGCFTAGGTNGNLSALVAARHLARSEDRLAGRGAIACTDEVHSSVQAAARVMDCDVVAVPQDARGHLTGTALRNVLAHEPRTVFAVVASAGTTNGGVIDDLADVADVCTDFGAWLHVDGAYGGAGLAAPSVRHRYAGIERADSFIVDPHKWLFAPYDSCALLYREPAYARAAHAQHAHYLDEIDREIWNPADLAIHLSRRARGLPFWFSLAVHGTDRYTAAVERTLTTTRIVAAGISDLPTCRLINDPELSVIVFERSGWTDADYRAWSQRLALAGEILCLPTKWQGRTVLRLAFVNPATDPEHVLEVLRETLAPDHDPDG